MHPKRGIAINIYKTFTLLSELTISCFLIYIFFPISFTLYNIFIAIIFSSSQSKFNLFEKLKSEKLYTYTMSIIILYDGCSTSSILNFCINFSWEIVHRKCFPKNCLFHNVWASSCCRWCSLKIDFPLNPANIKYDILFKAISILI